MVIADTSRERSLLGLILHFAGYQRHQTGGAQQAQSKIVPSEPMLPITPMRSFDLFR
jgi:hypothetical protein